MSHQWTGEDAHLEARSVEGDITDEKADDYVWLYEPAYPTKDIGVYDWGTGQGELMSRGEWDEWMRVEHENYYPDRAYLGPNSLEAWWLPDPTKDPLVIVEDPPGPAYLWSGHHRLALAYMHNLPTVPVFVGRRKTNKLKAKLLR